MSNPAAYDIPTEVYVSLIGRTVQIHWDFHAYLMFGVWFVLVPFGIIAIRYLKSKPTEWGVPRGVGRFDKIYVWWVMHIWSLYAGIGLLLAGMAMAFAVSGGFSGTLHSYFGIATVIFGALQIVVAWQRGSHGGRNHRCSDPDDPSTWHGDHYDMTPRRRWFEAYHKTAGYFAVMLALGAVATGLAQYWMPLLAVALAVLLIATLGLVIALERAGQRHDTYRVVFGTHPDHPYNKERCDNLNN